MRRIILGLILTLFAASAAFSQNSTTVSINATDAGSVAWANGTYQFTFVGQAGASWPGGGLANAYPTTPGSLGGSGNASQSVPNNATINPGPSFFNLTVCPNPAVTTQGSGCFTKQYTISGATQTINIVPPAITIPVPTVSTQINPVVAYADAEITGGWVGFVYNQTTGSGRVCTAVSSNTCSTWASYGSGGGGGTPCTTTALSFQYNNAGSFGCAADFTLSGAHTLAVGASGILNILGTVSGNVTGTGNIVLATSPTLVTPSLNAPAITAAMTGTGAFIPVSLLNSGTGATSSTFWRGDGTWQVPPGTISGGTTGFFTKYASATTIANSLCDEGITTANVFNCSNSGGAAFKLVTVSGAAGVAGGDTFTAGTAIGHGTASTVTFEAPAAVTAYEYVLPGAAATGISHLTNASGVMTESVSAVTSADATGNTSGSGNFCLTTSCVMTTPNLGTPSALVLTNATGLPNAGLTNSSITIAGTSVALGGSTSSLPSPGVIGGTTPAAATFTTVQANTSVSVGSSPPSITPGTGGALGWTEGTASTGLASTGILDANSTSHAVSVNNNNTGEMALSRTVCVNVTPVTVAASVTTDQNLMACTLSANTLNAVGHTLKIYTAGVYSTAAASVASITIKAKLCTVSGCGSGTVITPLSASTGATSALTASNLMAQLSGAVITQTAGATSAYEAQGSMLMDLSATATVASSVYPAINTATVGTIDATGQLFLQITVAFSAASASNSMTERQLVVELIN